MNANDNEFASLADMAARLLGDLLSAAQSCSDPAVVAEAVRIHDTEMAYPRLTISMPHNGGGVSLSLVLCHPTTDEPLVSLFTGEAKAIAPGSTH